jgi:hypothetical protein
MRSVVVVLPASMCAMIPMLRVFSSATLRAMSSGLRAEKRPSPGPLLPSAIARMGVMS